MQDAKKQNYLKGSAILAVASIFVKIVSALYRIPISNIIGDVGYGDFQAVYNVYTLFLTISTVGIPVAMSRLVSAANATGNAGLTKRYFKVALPAFAAIGVAALLAMFIFAQQFANAMHNTVITPGIRVLAPAVFFVCIISVYRGYTQGFHNMIPTAASQVVEVVSKLVFGIAAALWLTSRNFELPIVSAGAIMGVTIGLAICIPMLVWFKRRADRETVFPDDDETLPSRGRVLAQLLKVTIPIALGASFMSIITNIDTSVVLGRLQFGLHLTEEAARGLYGMYSKCLNVYNLPPALVVPVSVSIVPAIAAALARKNGEESRSITQSALKLINMLAMPACAGIMALSGPILAALFNDTRQDTVTILTILGAASFFVCFQLVSTAILQANGFERITMITYPIGGAVQIALDYYLVGRPDIGILGSPVGTLSCFAVISVLNVILILTKVKYKPKFSDVFIKPLMCTVVMAAAAYFANMLFSKLAASALGQGRLSAIAAMAAAIVVGLVVYLFLVVKTRAVTKDDLSLFPKGEKLAKILRVKQGRH